MPVFGSRIEADRYPTTATSSFVCQLRAYGLAVLLVALSLGVGWLLQDLLEPSVPYVHYYPAILVTARYGGAGPGTLATALAVLSAMWFLLHPGGAVVDRPGDLVSLGLFAAIGLFTVWLSHRSRAAATEATVHARRLEAIVASAMDAVILTDARLRVVFFNPVAERMFACPAAEAMGQPIDRFIPGCRPAAHGADLSSGAPLAATRRMGQADQIVGLRASGDEFPIEVAISPVRLPEPYYVVIARDITAHMRQDAGLHAGEQRYRAIFTASPIAMALSKMPEATIVEANDAFLALFEFEHDEVIGKTSIDLGISEPAAQAELRARFLRDGFVRHFECTRRTRSGDARNLVLDIVPVDVGGSPHVLTTVRDLTALRRAEQALVEQASLVRMGEMMTAVAHEIRNPLAGVRAVLQILGSRLPEDSPERGAAREAIAQVDALKDLVHDMLTFARPKPPRVGPIAIRVLLERTIEFFRVDPWAAGMAVVLEGDAPQVAGDASQLSRVFLNLLRNAAQAMDGRGRIDIRIHGDDRRCAVSVTDAGPGIPPEVRARLFQPFFTTKASGTGLGLATARQIVELHGGSVAVESEPGRGATFTVMLPIWQPVDAVQPPVRTAPMSASPPGVNGSATDRRDVASDERAAS